MLRPIGLVSRIGQHLRCLQMWVTGCGKHRSSPKSLPDFWKGEAKARRRAELPGVTQLA